MLMLTDGTFPALRPLTSNGAELEFGAMRWHEVLRARLDGVSGVWRDDFFPSDALLEQLRRTPDFTVTAPDGTVLGSGGGSEREELPADGVRLVYPWDLLHVAEMWLGGRKENRIAGDVHPLATLDGVLELGENSRILPGVYIEGICVIGKNCKIGPNCYLRGRTVIGDHCHIGQAVEIKNCVINSHTNIAHLSYVGDSVIGSHVNFGAGTIVGNLRHDGGNHRSMVDGRLIDTGRRKFGAVVGDGVHTGIHTSIYPGRKLFPGVSTLPGAVIRHDLQ